VEARWGVTWNGVEMVKDVTHGIRPKNFWEFSSNERRPDQISHSTICPFSNTVEGRGVRRSGLMMNTRGEKEGFKSFGNVFATIVRT
jgi:hypothetical protein